MWGGVEIGFPPPHRVERWRALGGWLLTYTVGLGGSHEQVTSRNRPKDWQLGVSSIIFVDPGS